MTDLKIARIIRDAVSQCNNPVQPANKANRSRRLMVDYCQLSSVVGPVAPAVQTL